MLMPQDQILIKMLVYLCAKFVAWGDIFVYNTDKRSFLYTAYHITEAERINCSSVVNPLIPEQCVFCLDPSLYQKKKKLISMAIQ